MAAYFFHSNGNDIFKTMPIVSNVNLDFITQFLAQNGAYPSGTNGGSMLVVSEVMFQNRDTIQYFLTFDDLISYFYFGKGLGTMTITGAIIADCDGGWNLYYQFMDFLGKMRGKKIGAVNADDGNFSDFGSLVVGGISFTGILNSFTVRSNTEPNSLNTVDFTLQLDIIDSSFARPTIKAAC